MQLISKTALQAVRALAELARITDGSYRGAGWLADQIGAPRNYLGKTLQQLARDGVLHSQKGLRGGFRLARPAESITLLHVVDPLDRVTDPAGCFMGRETCSDESACAIHHRWTAVQRCYLDFLDAVVLTDLLADPTELDQLSGR